jgi:S-adenosylmethionine:tRNA ribosyltransferase-isomerase
MDAEYAHVSDKVVKNVNHAKSEGKRVCAVGTTVMRALESSVTSTGQLKPYEGWTNLFIYPPFDFQIANALLTNFHVPKSSLLILACSFGGYDLIMKAYREAVEKKYKFFTYGDVMLIL